MTRVARLVVMLLGISVISLNPITALPALADGQGIRDSFNPPSSKPSKQKTKKAKVSKFKIYADNIEEIYRSQGMGYFFSSKKRMRRLLARLHEEHKAGEKHMVKRLDRIHANGLGVKNSKKLKPGLAFSVKKAADVYNDYKDGKTSKATYEERIKYWVGFVP